MMYIDASIRWRSGRSQQADVRAAIIRLSAAVSVHGSGAELQ